MRSSAIDVAGAQIKRHRRRLGDVGAVRNSLCYATDWFTAKRVGPF